MTVFITRWMVWQWALPLPEISLSIGIFKADFVHSNNVLDSGMQRLCVMSDKNFVLSSKADVSDKTRTLDSDHWTYQITTIIPHILFWGGGGTTWSHTHKQTRVSSVYSNHNHNQEAHFRNMAETLQGDLYSFSVSCHWSTAHSKASSEVGHSVNDCIRFSRRGTTDKPIL